MELVPFGLKDVRDSPPESGYAKVPSSTASVTFATHRPARINIERHAIEDTSRTFKSSLFLSPSFFLFVTERHDSYELMIY